jgi:hypothetical protein
MTRAVRSRRLRRIRRLVVSSTVAVMAVGLSAVPAHAGFSNHNETLLRRGRS